MSLGFLKMVKSMKTSGDWEMCMGGENSMEKTCKNSLPYHADQNN